MLTNLFTTCDAALEKRRHKTNVYPSSQSKLEQKNVQPINQRKSWGFERREALRGTKRPKAQDEPTKENAIKVKSMKASDSALKKASVISLLQDTPPAKHLPG